MNRNADCKRWLYQHLARDLPYQAQVCILAHVRNYIATITVTNQGPASGM